MKQMGFALLALSTVAAAPGDQAHAPVPAGYIAALFGPDAYPPDAMRAHEEGRVATKVAVDATGKPVSCTVTASSGSFALDDTTCAIAMSRLTFRPAVDAGGHAVDGVFPLAVRWQIPKEANPSPVPVTFTGSGDAMVCTALIEGVSRRLRPVSCHALAKAIAANGGRLDQDQLSAVSPDMLESAPR